MKAEIVAIGNEVLSGSIVNTNAAFISSILTQEGYPVVYHAVFPDNIDEIVKGLKIALERSDIIIVSGGLGPTLDDVTKEAVAKVFNIPLAYREYIAAKIREKTQKEEVIKQQALLPIDAKIMPNIIGTAVGMYWQKGNKIIAVFPGVPYELKEMFLHYFLPILKKQCPAKKTIHEKWLSFCLLSEMEINDFLKDNKEISFGLYPSLRGVKLHILAQNQLALEKCIKLLQEKFSKNLFSLDGATIEEVIHKEFILKKKSLALAESCSGGALCRSLVLLPGASKFLLGSVVSYSNDLKENILHVSKNVLEKQGAVSKETVEAMAYGLFTLTSCDYAVAISGIAGPDGGSIEKPVGTVWIAVGSKNNIKAHKFNFHAERKTIIEYSSSCALGLLWQAIHFSS